MPKQYAAILAEVIPAEGAVTGSDSSKQAVNREKLQKTFKLASPAQQRELQLRIARYSVTPDGEFITATTNLEASRN